MTMRRLIPAGVLMSVLCGSALAVPATPPNPVPRPDVGIVIAPEATSTALRPVAEALDRNDGASALAAARALPSGTVRETALWLVARSSVDGIDAQARFSLLDALAGWPDLALIQRRAEATLFEEDPDARGIARAMGSRQPAGFEGRILAARRHLSANERTAAANIIRPLWRTARLSSGAEALVIRDFAPLLTAQDHIERANRMIYDGRRASAETAMERLSATSRARLDARLIASRNTERGIAAIEALGAGALSDPHLRFSYVQVLRRSGAFSRAARILADAPSNPETLLDPDAWWVERRALARELLEEDKPREAYAVVTRRAQAGAGSEADAEFHAGWIALRFLNDAARAETHFRSIISIGTTPITLSRGHYWLGRALEARGERDGARAAYEAATRYPEAFYGQIAAVAIGREPGTLPALARVGRSERARFEARRFVEALRLVEGAGRFDDADALIRQIIAGTTASADFILLSELATNAGDHNAALMVGKLAAARDRSLIRLAYPTAAIPTDTRWPDGLEPAVGYAIARQESAFNPQAVSHAGARGLLQLMPATARRVASDIGLPFSENRLTRDAAYNATLGTHHLAELVAAQNGSYILTFAGYNAGAGRLPGWIERFGDPRQSGVDMVDWIEWIPFTETRNYVQRVLENVTVYRTLLGLS